MTRIDADAPHSMVRRRRRGRSADKIAPLALLMRRVEESSRTTGLSMDEAAAVVVEDLERAAVALNARVAPLVPGCGFLVAVAGLLFRVEPSSQRLAEFFIGLAVISAVGGMCFLTRAVFLYAGRGAVGLTPTVDDIPFAHSRLVRKHRSAERGGWLAGFSLACVVIGILVGVHLQIVTG